MIALDPNDSKNVFNLLIKSFGFHEFESFVYVYALKCNEKKKKRGRGWGEGGKGDKQY